MKLLIGAIRTALNVDLCVLIDPEHNFSYNYGFHGQALEQTVSRQ